MENNSWKFLCNNEHPYWDLLQKAEAQNADACAELGKKYIDGDGVERNEECGMHLTAAAAKLGSARAREALISYAEEGNPFALWFLGLLYKRGIVFERDAQKAEECFAKAAAKKLRVVADWLRAGLYNSNIPANEEKLRLAVMRRLAISGNPAGLNNVGEAFATGHGTKLNFLTALAFFWLAKEKGNIIAEQNFDAVFEKCAEYAPREEIMEAATKHAAEINAEIKKMREENDEQDGGENGQAAKDKPEYAYDHGDHSDFLFGKLNDDGDFIHKLGGSFKTALPNKEFGQHNSIVVYENSDDSGTLKQIFLLKRGEKDLIFCSSFPHLTKGITSAVKILEIREWDENKVEANVVAHLESGNTIEFFLPFAPRDCEKIEAGKWYNADLSAILFDAKKADIPEFFEIERGLVFEEHKEQYMREHPDCSEDDVQPARIYTNKMTMFNLIDGYSDHYHFMGDAGISKPVEFLGRKFRVFQSEISCRQDTIKLNLCAPEYDGFADGDKISAVAWLQGFNFVPLTKDESKIRETALIENLSNDEISNRMFAFYDLKKNGLSEASALVCATLPSDFEIIDASDNDDFSVVKAKKGGDVFTINIASNLSGTKSKFTADDIENLTEDEKAKTCFVNFEFQQTKHYLKPSFADVLNFEKIIGKPSYFPESFANFSEDMACDMFAAAINEKNFDGIFSHLVKNVQYKSYWGGKIFNTDSDTINNYKRWLKALKSENMEASAKIGVAHLKGGDAPCVVLLQGEAGAPQSIKPASINILRVKHGMITEIYVFDANNVSFTINERQPRFKFVPISEANDNFGAFDENEKS